MKYSHILLITAAMLVAPRIEQGYVLAAVVLALLALVIEITDRKK